MTTDERELTAPVDLCTPDGRLNRAAVGWSRHPLHTANLRGWGRTKRWEYWCFTTPTHLVAVTVSDLDYLALNSLYVLEFAPDGSPSGTGPVTEFERTAIVPFGRGVTLPPGIAGSGTPTGSDAVVGPEKPRGGRLRVEITHAPAGGGTRVRARAVSPSGAPVELDVTALLPASHETLSVVVPWSDNRFQYTSKHTARPASGTLRLGDRVLPFTPAATPADPSAAWATLDHGRGRWPRAVTWNWGAASGYTDGHTVGLQFGGKWTDGTGSTENALCVDGRLSKIGADIAWHYDPADVLAPWSLRSPQLDLTFTPFHNRRARTEAGLIANRTNQCFGHYSGRIHTDSGQEIAVDRLLGWAEEVAMRW